VSRSQRLKCFGADGNPRPREQVYVWATWYPSTVRGVACAAVHRARSGARSSTKQFHRNGSWC
jgi:hypothetical protein